MGIISRALDLLEALPESHEKRWLLGKVERFRPKDRLRRARGAPKSTSQLKRELWEVFSEYVRRRDAFDGEHAKCCTCSTVKHWKDLQAGHFVTAKLLPTKYDEKNVHAQCQSCNMPPNNGKRIEYAEFLRKKYDSRTPEILELASRNSGFKLGKVELTRKIAHYKELIR